MNLARMMYKCKFTLYFKKVRIVGHRDWYRVWVDRGFANWLDIQDPKQWVNPQLAYILGLGYEHSKAMENYKQES